MADVSIGIVSEVEDVDTSTEDDDDKPSTSNHMQPPLFRMDTVLSDGGGHYDILPLPSPGVDETECSDDGIFTNNEPKPIKPYMSVYSGEELGQDSAFLAKTDVTVKIVDAVRDVTFKHPLNPNLYTIDVTHGQFKWTIHKRFKHFLELHEKLWAYQTSLRIPIPSRKHRKRRKSRRTATKQERKIPKFPKKPEIWVSGEDIEKRKGQLESYLNAMLESGLYRNYNSTRKFLEVSRLSFVQDLGMKRKEGIIRKRSGGHKIKLAFCSDCCNLRNTTLFAKWRNRWLVVKDTFVAYLDLNQETVKGILLFDALICVHHENPSNRLVISNASRSLNVNCWTDRQALEWKNAIEENVSKYCAGLTDQNIRFQSFAPPRPDSLAHWFVDGRTYMEAVADAMEDAKEEIFITDWWLSPEIYLKRPITRGDYWRLDMILQRKAMQGVKIYVQLYKEVEMAVGLNSAYSKRTLLKLHPKNIQVMRHPDLAPGESLLWAHHEKIVVIDQVIAFVGGIDLCYGRWDDHIHKLTDVGTEASPTTEVADVVHGPESLATSARKKSSTAMVFGMFGTMTMGLVSQVSLKEADQEVSQLSPPKSAGATKDESRFRKFFQSRKKIVSPSDSDTEEEVSPLKKIDSLDNFSGSMHVQCHDETDSVDALSRVSIALLSCAK